MEQCVYTETDGGYQGSHVKHHLSYHQIEKSVRAVAYFRRIEHQYAANKCS